MGGSSKTIAMAVCVARYSENRLFNDMLRFLCAGRLEPASTKFLNSRSTLLGLVRRNISMRVARHVTRLRDPLRLPAAAGALLMAGGKIFLELYAARKEA